MPGFGDIRRAPGVTDGEDALPAALVLTGPLPITDYDRQGAQDIARQLRGFSQRELRQIETYERQHENRATITHKLARLTGSEPWPGYDELTAEAVTEVLAGADPRTARKVRSYERDHRHRAVVIAAVTRRIAAG